MSIKTNLQTIRHNIEQACVRSGRNVNDVKIVAVSKTVAVPQIREAIAAGIDTIGENRVPDALLKHQEIGNTVAWHLIGHLQTNKVKKALQIFNVIESVDSLHLAEEIDRRAQELNKIIDIFVQVNTSGEAGKTGFPPEQVEAVIPKLAELTHVRITGLMTIGALVDDPELARPEFCYLRNLRALLNEKYHIDTLQHLSMGMTNDYHIAIEEGATCVRIGRALFGERS
ncbi:MAG TPA: YggS family pyridoxal phosphate-dependent enzyme [bacterium]|nr:YggS family pyridoxal phosphate-dependent enzyme [bacterium]HPN45809.1 YggS family pyridoxal phosphate-dependent enzyme [bacterium]